MRTGNLRHRITIQQKMTTTDSEGIPIETWTDFATVWAAVEPTTGKEFWEAQAINQENTVRFRIRYLNGIRPYMQVIYKGRTFRITAIMDAKERHREMQIMGLEVVV